MPAGLEDVREGHEIGLHIIVRMAHAVTDARLSREMYHAVKAMRGKAALDIGLAGKVCSYEAVGPIRSKCRFLELLEACLFQTWIIIGIDGIEPHHVLAPLDEGLCNVKSDEPGIAGDQYLHTKAAFRTAV